MCAAPFLLLVNPWITDFAAHDLWAKPLGLLMIGSLLRQGGCQVAFVDCLDRHDPATNRQDDVLPPTFQKFGTGKYAKMPIPTPDPLAELPRNYFRYGIHPESLIDRLENLPRPNPVLTTCGMTYWYPGLQQTIQIIRQVHPGVTIWLGGTYARLCADHARQHSGADQVITESLPNLPERIRAALGFSVTNPSCWTNMDKWPVLDGSLLDNPGCYAPLLTSLGCPYACPYCASSLLEPRRQRLSANTIVNQVEQWHRLYKSSDFAFYDDALLFEAESTLKPALENLAQLDLGVRFHTPNAVHVSMLSLEWCKLLFQSGFHTLRLGLEATQKHLQRDLGNKANTDMFLNAMDNLCSVGFPVNQVGVYLLCGLSNQSPQDVYEAIQLVAKTGAKPLLSEYSPIPGTSMFHMLPADQLLGLRSEPLTHNNSFFACRRSDFTYQDLLELKHQARLARRAQNVV